MFWRQPKSQQRRHRGGRHVAHVPPSCIFTIGGLLILLLGPYTLIPVVSCFALPSCRCTTGLGVQFQYVTIPLFSAGSFRKGSLATTTLLAVASEEQNTAKEPAPSSVTFPLAVFPLRKLPRLPTDLLTLNLYEPRYLTMAEHILEGNEESSSELYLFGAIFSSDKPQLVSKAIGPVVPMLQPGDTGTLFYVEDDWKDDIVLFDRNDPSQTRRRIQLNGMGLARFQIQSIRSDGSSGDEGTSNSPYPFILVDATLVLDEVRENTAGSQAGQDQLRDAVLEVVARKELLDCKSSIGDPDALLNLQASSMSRVDRALLALLKTNFMEPSKKVILRDELLSFYAGSALSPSVTAGRASPQELLSLLSDRSTTQRFERIAKYTTGLYNAIRS